MDKIKGTLCVISAAVIFGFMPILSKLTYLGGSNSFMLVFLRSSMCLPVLLIILIIKKVSLKVPANIIGRFFIYSLFTTTFTALLLFTSYNYVSVGIATTIHYVYPIVVALTLFIFFKEKISIDKIICLVISFAGILMFFDGKTSISNIAGLIIAFLSGVCYSLSLVFMDKGGIKDYYPFLITFYSCLFSTATMAIITMLSGKFTINLTTGAWIHSFVLSNLVSVIAVTFMQIGVKYIGATTTAILAMIEPITSIILGILLFNEQLTLKNLLGCILILSSVIIISIFNNKNKELTSSSFHKE